MNYQEQIEVLQECQRVCEFLDSRGISYVALPESVIVKRESIEEIQYAEANLEVKTFGLRTWKAAGLFSDVTHMEQWINAWDCDFSQALQFWLVSDEPYVK